MLVITNRSGWLLELLTELIKDIAFYKVAVNAHQWMEEEGEKWQKVRILSIQSVPSILSILIILPPDFVQGEFC